MLKIADNFALGIRLNWVYLYGSGHSLKIDLRRGQYCVTVKTDETSFKTEREVFQFLRDSHPDELAALQTYPNLYYRGMHRRAELLLSLSDSELEERMEAFKATGRKLFDAAVEQLGLTVMTKKLSTRPTAVKRGISAWYFRANCLAASWPDKQNVTVRYFPSPVVDGNWWLQVDMPTFSNEELLEFQLRMKSIGPVVAEKGITLDDVAMCTYLQL